MKSLSELARRHPTVFEVEAPTECPEIPLPEVSFASISLQSTKKKKLVVPSTQSASNDPFSSQVEVEKDIDVQDVQTPGKKKQAAAEAKLMAKYPGMASKMKKQKLAAGKPTVEFDE